MKAGSKTWNAKPGEVERRWLIVDAEGKTLGRLAVPIADALRGKNKPQYTPHVDTGEQLEHRPTEVLRKAVKGMLPRNRLGRAQITKLKIYAGPEHPHEAQTPQPLEVGS